MSNSAPLECFHFHCKLHWDLSGSECVCVCVGAHMWICVYMMRAWWVQSSSMVKHPTSISHLLLRGQGAISRCSDVCLQRNMESNEIGGESNCQTASLCVRLFFFSSPLCGVIIHRGVVAASDIIYAVLNVCMWTKVSEWKREWDRGKK